MQFHAHAKRPPLRKLRCEGLEARQMLTAVAGATSDAWAKSDEQVSLGIEVGVAAPGPGATHTNVSLPPDVNADGKVTARDALMVVNAVLLHGPGEASGLATTFLLDVNADGTVNLADAQSVVDSILSAPQLAVLNPIDPVPGTATVDAPVASHPLQIANDLTGVADVTAVGAFEPVCPRGASRDSNTWLVGTHRSNSGDFVGVPRTSFVPAQLTQVSTATANRAKDLSRPQNCAPTVDELDPAAVDEVFGLIGRQSSPRHSVAANGARFRPRSGR